jgi:hypothetical protein
MNSEAVQEAVYQFLKEHRDYYNAPYGIITGGRTEINMSSALHGRRYKSITFGCARTMDAEVRIYNRNFMLLRVNDRKSEVFKNLPELLTRLVPSS